MSRCRSTNFIDEFVSTPLDFHDSLCRDIEWLLNENVNEVCDGVGDQIRATSPFLGMPSIYHCNPELKMHVTKIENTICKMIEDYDNRFREVNVKICTDQSSSDSLSLRIEAIFSSDYLGTRKRLVMRSGIHGWRQGIKVYEVDDEAI